MTQVLFFLGGAVLGVALALMGLWRWAFGRPAPIDHFPHITSDTLGISPRSDGRGQLRCDICGNLRPYQNVYVSPGDGFSECSTCSPEIFSDAALMA